jgi:hypothetical protein
MFSFRNFSIIAVAIAILPLSAAADKIWSPSEVLIRDDICPQTTSRKITVEGYLGEPLESENGVWMYDITDKQHEFPLITLSVYSERKLNVQDNARVRVTGPCTRKGSMDDVLPAIWVDRIAVR